MSTLSESSDWRGVAKDFPSFDRPGLTQSTPSSRRVTFDKETTVTVSVREGTDIMSHTKPIRGHLEPRVGLLSTPLPCFFHGPR